jgi:hypothetical protein
MAIDEIHTTDDVSEKTIAAPVVKSVQASKGFRNNTSAPLFMTNKDKAVIKNIFLFIVKNGALVVC